MLEEKFETWPEDRIFNAILFTFSIYITNLDYLKDKPLCFTKLQNGGTEEFKTTLKRLNNPIAISNNDNKHLPDLSNLKAKWAKKKKEKVQKCYQKKIKLI